MTAGPPSSSGTSTSSTPSAQSPGTSQPTTAATSTTQALQSIDGIPTKKLSQWLKIGSNGLMKWTSVGLAAVEKSLTIGNPKPTATKPSLNLEAQVLVSPSAEASSAPLPAAVPEPGTWLTFGLILGAAGLWQRAGRTASGHRTGQRQRGDRPAAGSR
jgi:hypothetical protein